MIIGLPAKPAIYCCMATAKRRKTKIKTGNTNIYIDKTKVNVIILIRK
jgi:hypothetical protein